MEKAAGFSFREDSISIGMEKKDRIKVYHIHCIYKYIRTSCCKRKDIVLQHYI